MSLSTIWGEGGSLNDSIYKLWSHDWWPRFSSLLFSFPLLFYPLWVCVDTAKQISDLFSSEGKFCRTLYIPQTIVVVLFEMGSQLVQSDWRKSITLITCLCSNWSFKGKKGIKSLIKVYCIIGLLDCLKVLRVVWFSLQSFHFCIDSTGSLLRISTPPPLPH